MKLFRANKRWSEAISYLITKLSGAGFSIFIFFIATLFLADFDMYEASIEEGGYGHYVLNEENDFVGMNEVAEKTHRIKVKESGIYRIIVTGDNLKGSFQVTWHVD
ncbi:hypothetical protein [Bacillus alveayuensis]|uniref:hypothetical protein n=1 Tax=Aeribacillus alveayuensis TaxID=279215 RepID=UPI0005D115B1|nr:hypothetical protein [Bacillus alveayuensis]